MPNAQLVELYAHGLGIIDDARVEFGPGFNVLTGETGAGKTLLLDALTLCLGADGVASRFSSRDVRAAAVFSRPDGTELVLSRETGANGRLRSLVNAVPSSAEALRSLSGEMVVIHGQHDSLTLRQRADVVRLLDASGGVDTSGLDAVRRELSDALALRDALGGDQSARQRELDFLAFQIDELEGARLTSSDELDDALAELTRLSELRDGQTALARALVELDDDTDEGLLVRLASVIEHLPATGPYDAARTDLRQALDLARDVAHDLASLTDPDAFDPAVIATLEERIALLSRLARKHGGTLADALATLAHLRDQRDEHMAADERASTLGAEIEKLRRREASLAAQVRAARQDAAERLTAAVARQLPRVALTSASLSFEVDGDDGSRAQILFSANPGQPAGPLQTLASGGELSRVLLALSLETAHDDVVAVYDEVDAGIGGQVAQQIGACLAEVGRHQQVLAITHLASVAARADHHFVIEKTIEGEATTTTVRPVEGEERVDEIARMLAGDHLSAQSRALARQLLETQS